MDLTPSSWKKSEVTVYKKFIKKGMQLFPQGGGSGHVMEVEGDNFLFRDNEDQAGEWEEWYNANNLQLGWNFTSKDREFIQSIINH